MNANIIKSENLYFVSQPFDFNGKMFLSMTVGFGFSLTDNPKILPVDQAFATAISALQNGECFDMGVAKKFSEFLIAGNAYSPNNQATNQILVNAKVANKSRGLVIKSNNKNHTFTQQLLSWKNTTFDEVYNPLGYKNLDDNSVYIFDIDNEKLPANYAPTGIDWKFKQEFLGKKYDKQWLQQKWRSVADDFSFEFFNLSQTNSPQRLDENQTFTANTPIELTNLNQTKSQISTRIPEKFLENKITYKDGKQISADFKADTLWLFPNQEIGILLFHSNVETNNSAAENISEIHLALTPEDAPEIPVAEVAAVAGAVAGVAAVASAADNKDNKKENSPQNPPEQQNSENTENAEKNNQNLVENQQKQDAPPPLTLEQKQAQAKSEFHDSIAEINEGLKQANQPPLTPEQIKEIEQRLDQYIAMQDQIETQAKQIQPKTPEQVLRELGIDEKTIQGINKLENLEQPDPSNFDNETAWKAAVEKYIAQKEAILPSSPETQNMMRQVLYQIGPGGIEDQAKAAQQRGDFEPHKVFANLGLDPTLLDKIEQQAENMPDIEDDSYPAYVKKMEKELGFEDGAMSTLMIAVHNQIKEIKKQVEQQQGITPKVVEPIAEKITEKPENVEKTEKNNENLVENVPISEIPKVAADKKDGKDPLLAALAIGGAALVGFKLAGVDLKGHNFADQDLRGVDFSGADLQNADFSRSNLENVKFSDAKIDEATFFQSNLNNAKMDNVSAKETDFSEANINNLNLEKSNLQQAKFYKNNSENINISNANCAETRWQFCDLKNVNLQNSKLQKADFHQSSFNASNFENTNLQECSFAFQSCAEQSNFKNANLSNSVFENSSLNNSNFESVKANNTRFDDCNLTNTNFTNSQAKNSYFTRSNLTQSNFSKANLMYADLSEVNNSAANFNNSSLCGADLYKFDESKVLNLDKANTQRTIVSAKKA